jgi:multidrug resistance efflux pump
MKKFFIFLGVVIVITIIIISYISIKNKKQQDIQIIDTDVVKIGNVSGFLQETGIIKAQVGAQISVGARATGTITMLKVKVGDKVKKGELVALIDDREILAQIQEAKVSLASINKEIEQENTLYPIKKDSLQKELDSNRSKLTFAKSKYEREKELFNRGFSTAEQLDSVKTDYDLALNAVKTSEIAINQLENEHRLTLDTLRLKKNQQEKYLTELNVRLTYTRIYSPIDGVVSQVNADEGETIVAGLQVANLITVFNPNMLEMWIYIDETDIGQVKLGDYVEYTVDTYGDKKFTGTLKKIYYEPVIKDNIVYYLGIVEIDRITAEQLRPEMTTHVKIKISDRKNVLTVKNGAIKFEAGEQVVYKVVDKKTNKVERQLVQTGIKGDDRTEILSGLKENDVVAVRIILPPGFAQKKPVSEKRLKRTP